MLLAGLSTGHSIGLAVVAAIFIGFALVSSFLAPRRWPDFPGKVGMGIFAAVCVLLFGAQLTSVWVFGAEAKGAEHAAAGAQGAASSPHTMAVQEKEFSIVLPAQKTLAAGSYTFEVKNVGKIPHDFAVAGGKLAAPAKTPTIAPGQSAKLTVTLAQGTYQLYCTIPGHRGAGMLAKLTIA